MLILSCLLLYNVYIHHIKNNDVQNDHPQPYEPIVWQTSKA